MKRAWPIVMSLSLAALALYGCDKETPEDEVASTLDEYEVEINDQVDVVCDCYQEFLFGDAMVQFENKGDCKAGLGEILPARRRCLDDAFAQDIEVSQKYLDCFLPLETELASCLNDKLDCNDSSSLDACSQDYNLGVESCISLPQSVERDLMDCYD